MKIIFEDHKDTPSSKLISYLNQTDIVFASANTRIAKCIRNIIKVNPDEKIIVYMDLIPDNPATCEIFNKLTNDNLLNDNIVIMPIICAEYLLAKMICKYVPNVNVPVMRDVVGSVDNTTNWRDTTPSDFNDCKSLEKVFKRFFREDSNYLMSYYWNIAKNTNGFYSVDDILTVEEKCKILWYSLPLYPSLFSDSELLKRCNLVSNLVQWADIINVLREEINRFNKLFTAYGCKVLPMRCA